MFMFFHVGYPVRSCLGGEVVRGISLSPQSVCMHTTSGGHLCKADPGQKSWAGTVKQERPLFPAEGEMPQPGLAKAI